MTDESPAPSFATPAPDSPAYQAFMIAKAQGSVLTVNGRRVDTAPAPNAAAQTAAAGRATHQRAPGGQRLNADGTFETWGEQSDPNARIDDVGQNTAHLGAQIMANINTLEAKLAEQVFDEVTGKGSPKITGVERTKLEAAAKQARISAQFDLQQLQRLDAQRNADKARETQAKQEELAAYTFAKGDPARAKAYQEAMLQEEAQEAARLVIAARRGNR